MCSLFKIQVIDLKLLFMEALHKVKQEMGLLYSSILICHLIKHVNKATVEGIYDSHIV